MRMPLENWYATRWLFDVSEANAIEAYAAEAYRRVIVDSADDDSVRILDARLKRHPWRGDNVELELRWTCERSMKIRA
jgi:hypothetical protein